MFTLSKIMFGNYCVQTTGYIDVCLKGSSATRMNPAFLTRRRMKSDNLMLF